MLSTINFSYLVSSKTQGLISDDLGGHGHGGHDYGDHFVWKVRFKKFLTIRELCAVTPSNWEIKSCLCIKGLPWENHKNLIVKNKENCVVCSYVKCGSPHCKSIVNITITGSLILPDIITLFIITFTSQNTVAN